MRSTMDGDGSVWRACVASVELMTAIEPSKDALQWLLVAPELKLILVAG
ncbi:hypothetical protein [Nocardia stercoris]|nr:hypothetical protein [Nocardia stercoris]